MERRSSRLWLLESLRVYLQRRLGVLILASIGGHRSKSEYSSLEDFRTDRLYRTVPELSVLVHLDILEYLLTHGIPGLESLTMDRLPS